MVLFSKPVRINCVFFALFFVSLSLLHIYHVLLIDRGSLVEQGYFSLQVVGQISLETVAMILLIHFLPRLALLWCIASFALLSVLRFLDFPLIRLLGLSVWDATTFVSKEQIFNFVEQLYASNVSMGIWITGGLIGFALVELGVVAYYLTERFAKKIAFSMRTLLFAFGAVALSMAALELGSLFFVSGISYEHYAQALPWKRGLLHRDGALVTLPFALKPRQFPEEIAGAPLKRNPDIFLFVAESLREDYINRDIAPHLVDFRKKNIALDLTVSNANATQPSWFSIFHSRFPIYWGKKVNRGGVPIRILKELGYKIHVYTAARLSFFNMDEIIFGEGTQLADSIFTFFGEESDPPWERDARAVEQLCQDIPHAEGGRLFIVFLDATHFDYSWPEEETAFLPIEEQVNYMKLAFFQGELEPLKNRYRNSIAFIDTLFGRVMEQLKKRRESVVVFTGDHGEEFYESGHLFHASALSAEQTRVPLYYKIGMRPKTTMSSHVDIFPSILHYLVGDERYSALMDGQSIFSKERWPYLVTARYNVGRPPYEFMLQNANGKLLARFSNQEEIFKSDTVRILSLDNVEEKYIAQEFGEAFNLLFSTR